MTDLFAVRSTVPGPWAPTRTQLVELSLACSEAADNAQRGNRPATADSFESLRRAIMDVLRADPIEHAFLHRAGLADERDYDAGCTDCVNPDPMA